jgi:hypothetical protein
MIMVVAAAIRDVLRALASRAGNRYQIGLAMGALAGILIGVLGGHGAPAARTVLQAEHGSRVPWNDQGLEIRPDHRGPGLFLLQHSKPGDIVIAEDALELRWYAGQTDYWFRSLADAGRYLYRDENDILRDIYVGAALLDGVPGDDLLHRSGVGVWFVTSGETAMSRTWYLSPAQLDWLDSLQASTKPVFMGEDDTTAVYCFGRCP